MVKLVFYAGPSKLAMATDINGHSCQHYAAHFGHKHILKFFMRRIVDDRSIVSSETNTSLLHVAVNKGHSDLVRFMLSRDVERKANF